MSSERLALASELGSKPFDFVDKSTDYEATISDLGRCLNLTGSTDRLFTLPNVGTDYIGSRIRCMISGTATLTINPYSGGSINDLKNLISKHQYAWVELVIIAANTWMIYSNSNKYSQYNFGSWHLLPDPKSGYSYVKEIRISKDRVSGSSNITDYPMVFSSIHADLKTTGNGGYVTDSNGYDIIFTASDGTTQLDHEIEKYVVTTGEFIAHVRIPTLKYNEYTIIYLHYGNSGVSSSQENITGVWDSNFIGVYHFNNNVLDSTDNDNDGTDQGTSDATGKINSCRSFEDDYIQLDAVVGEILTTKGTLTAWITIDTTSDDQQLWQLYTDADNQIYTKYTNSTNTFRMGRIADGTDKYVETTVIVEGGTSFRKITLTWDETEDELKVYLDGEQIGSTQTSIDAFSGSLNASTNLGATYDESGTWEGDVDEVRISGIARSADWELTEFLNQDNPDKFYTLA